MALVMYERLERYDERTGEYKGAHVKLFDTTTQREGDAMSYAAAATLGVTESNLLTQIEAGAIMAADVAIATKVAMEAERDSAKVALEQEQRAHAATVAQANSLLAAAQAEINRLTTELATATSGATGV